MCSFSKFSFTCVFQYKKYNKTKTFFFSKLLCLKSQMHSLLSVILTQWLLGDLLNLGHFSTMPRNC